MNLGHGIRFTTSHLIDIHNLIMEFREEVEAAVKAAMTKKMADEMSADHDNRRYINPPKEGDKIDSLYWTAFDRFQKGKKRSEDGMRSQYDFDLSISILPFEGKVYGLVFAEQPFLREMVAEQPWIEAYGFWDSTDPDENVPREEWEERQRVWSAILERRYIAPVHLGFTAEFNFTATFWPGAEELLAVMPSVEERLKKAAWKKVADEYFAARMAEKREAAEAKVAGTDEAPTPPHLYAMTTFFDTESWVKSEEGQVKLAAARAELEPLIQPYTKEDFAS
jgi:hypothetical protein